ncbi:MAG: DUF481 domain-containing protein [Kangiellaceae bacterium]|jgi:putative salt-induced outer membrane protein|nr:DUF481 domain-containing protein [Kangiellaceae bacterium]
MKKILILLMILSSSAWSEEASKSTEQAKPAVAKDQSKQEPKWTGKAELGFVTTSGNTETSANNGRLVVTYEAEKWKERASLEFFQAESVILDENNNRITQETADRTYFFSKTDYKFNKKSFAFMLIDYADENFTDKDYIANFSLGYGHTFVKDDEEEFNVELGLGSRRFQFQNQERTEIEAVYRLAAHYFIKVSESAQFTQDVSAEFGELFDIYKTNTALNLKVNTSMQVSIGYQTQHTSNVQPGILRNDSQTTVNLVYNFL